MSRIQEFILSAADNFFGLPARDEQKHDVDALNDFIYNPHTLLLQIFVRSDQKFSFDTKIQGGVKKCLIFYKTSAIDLNSQDAVNYINIVTMTTDAAESLYQILRQVYSPLLAIGEDLYSSKLQKNILDLESNLRILTNGKDCENVGVILCIEDEIEYWKAVGLKKDTNKKERETASFFSILFEDIYEEIRSLQSSSLQEIRDSVENIAAILDDVWRYTSLPYSEDRMMHIFDIIGHIVCSVIQKKATHIDLWATHDSTKDNAALTFLSEALNIVQTWINGCKSLTEIYWPNYALHPWKGKPYISIFCSNFEARLKEIHNIRSTYNQLTKLLTKNEKQELNSDGLLKHFKDINIWICNGPNQSWESASARFAADLRPAEAKIAEKLKSRMHNTTTKQMLYEFIRYKSLINRPLVKHALSNELELFVGSLLSMLKSIHNALDSDQLDVDVKMHRPAELSPLVQQVQWAKQMEAKVTEILTCTEKYLNDFDNSVEVLKLSSQVLKDLKTMYTQLHEDWARDVQAQLKDGSLQLSGDKPVVEFSASDRLMVVRFEPRLVRVESEARALAALGLPLPPTTTSSLQAFTAPLKHARVLHQVASFHNTLGERMIPSTRPMMLQAALELASLVQDHQPLYWHLEEQLINFTDKLKQMVLKLEGQNTYLTGQHLAIRSIVEKLMDTELLAEQSEWKRGIKEIRDIIEKADVNGYKNTEMWRLHWDLQLYKALECQYIKTLISLQTHFPNIRVDLVLRGRSVCVQPPMEEIRVQHYSQLRRLVSLPNHFTGLNATITDDKSIFASIVDKHSWLGNKAVAQLESALANLHRVCTKWTQNLALACVDLDALCAEHLKKPSDWEWNFKACKSYGQVVAKMTFDDEKIEWITVGTFTLRREFEAQARNLWAALMSSLQASCRDDTLLLDSFMANASVTLENRTMPKNSKELAEVSAKQQALQQKMPEMEKTVEDLKRKSHLLRTWGGDSSLENTVLEWQHLREQVQVHHQMFEHQAEIVKTSLKGEWENLHNGIEALVSRWNQAKPRLEDTRDVAYIEMVDRCRSVFDAVEHFNKFESERNELMLECEKFNLNIESSEVWKEAENLKAELLNIWTIFKTYNDDYETIAEQEWIVFQKKLHLLDDFIYKWNGLLEPFTSITLFLKQELDRYTELTAALKYLRGSDFTETHWREVFGLLQMEYIKPEALQLKNFLNVANSIKKQMKALQKISTSASSEATIRTVLNELEIWYASARLVIIYYTDKSEKLIPIIKDYKDLLTKIEEQQWVVSSVGGSAYMACATWDARLRTARSLVRAAHHAQRRWLYLEPILSKDDGELGVKFRKVDQGFKQVSRIIESDPRLSTLVQSTRLQPMLDSISEQLNACQSALNQYIDAKRLIFPRLYFLSDDDLLEILGQARAGAKGRDVVMQSHLKKLFPGITGVNLGPQELSITALCSYEETFQLDHPVDIDCAVEMWLKNLEQEIRSSLQNMALKCLVSYNLHDQDPFLLPTQILCLSQNIRFTDQAEKAITSKELHKLKDNLDKESLYYAGAEVENDTEKYKKQALILQCAFYVSVVEELIEHNVVAINDWCWQKQLRFYLQNTKEIIIRMGLAEISYSYEYLGVNTGQFVRTETTDESFLILMQSIHLGQMGNPFGPAGTGKTESVKALGALVGRLVLVFNCDEAMDAECMGRLLTGVALCGAWGCFDEFNRLSANTLAAISHQLVSLLAATCKDSTTEHMAVLNGKQVRVSDWCGVAATMNPAGRGYGGRRALPPALLHALRPLALRPPPRYILSARLLAARATFPQLLPGQLSADLDNVFTLASTLLSSQRHYDWGLRALKSAVGSCGNALNTRGPCSEIEQRTILRNVLRLNNLSKLTIYDAERFENILNMVFANVPNEKNKVEPLYDSLTLAVKKLDLVHNKLQIQKCTELYEQLQQRMGVVIVGPPGSGKSTIRQLLKSALSLQGKNIMEYVIYPKAMSRSWLLGHIEQDTRQWTDGVFSTVALELSNQIEDVWSWVVCDGDVDPEWIEALNSVLDDNRLLTLPSGWRVQFGQNVNFIFETHSLEYASPATISRMGIILLSSEKQCSEEVLESWTQKKTFENETAKMAIPFLNETVKKFLRWISLHRSDLIIKDCCISLVKQILVQFENIIQETNSRTPSNEEDIVWAAVQLSVISLLKSNAIDSFYEEIPRLLHQENHDMEWADTLLRSSRIQACEPALRAAVLGNNDIIVIGPDASAKNLLAEYVLKETNSNVITIDCTPIMEPEDIIAELKRKNAINGSGVANMGSLGNAGGNFRILLVRALDRAQRDQWGSCRIHSFILQLMQQNGFWAREEGIPQWYSGRFIIVATASTAIQSPRLGAFLSPIILSEPDEDELLELIRTYLLESVAKNITDKDISHLSRNMLSLYKEVTNTFHSKPHYKWNPSHLKKWCENIKWYSPSNLDEVIMALNAEANILFKERLVLHEEKSQYNKLVQNYLRAGDDVYFKQRLRSDGIYLEAVEYEEWHKSTQKLINQCLTDDEYIFGDPGIDVCNELSTLSMAIALTLNGGVLTCIGSAGVGRRQVARLVTTALSATLVNIDQQAQFYTMFKNALTSASEGIRTLVVISESVASGQWLACIEAFLKADSLQVLSSNILPTTQPHTSQSLINIKLNLGILICLDKEQDNLSTLLDSSPLLCNNRLAWIEQWSSETLKQMPSLLIQRLSKYNAQEMSQEDLSSIPIEGFLQVYKNLEAKTVCVPVKYLHFIKSYYHIFSTKKQTLLQRLHTLSAGVKALRSARSEVATLQAEAAQQETALSEEQFKANQALDQIGATVRATTDKKEEMHQLKKNIEMENEKLQVRKKEIEAELASVEPVIAAARAAVGDIRPESLSEVRSLRAPPDVVRDVLEGVLRLMGIADTSWHSMKSFLSKRGVKEDIRCLDASQISSEAAHSVERLLERRGASFEQATAKRASAACAPLAAWVLANLAYARALSRVRPLQEQQRHLHKNLQQAENELAALSSGLVTVDERVAALKEQLGQHTREAATIEIRVKTTTDTINAARDLLDQLAQEYDSWETHLQSISQEIVNLNDRSLLAAAYLTYLPDLTETQARNYLLKWSELIGFTETSFSVINFLSSPEKQLKWEADGLPLDQSAIKNAISIDQYLEHGGPLIPLVIDPEGEAETWLRGTLHQCPVDFVAQHSDNLYTALQLAVRLGRQLVITDVDSIEEWWWVMVRGGRARVVLVTRSTLATTPCVLSYLAPLHFAPRLHALVDQMIYYAMQKQNPEMNKKAREIKQTKAALQKQQYELQENLLKDLTSNGNILHDANLLGSLKKTRMTSSTITEALLAAKAIEEETRAACEVYEESATRAATLSLAVKQLALQHPLISLPMDAVFEMFENAVSKNGDTKDINNDKVVKNFTRRIIERVLLSLHKKDKYTVVMHLLHNVYDNLIPEKLWNLFIGNFNLMVDKNVLIDIENKCKWANDCIRKIAQIKMVDEDFFVRLNIEKNDFWLEFNKSGDLHFINRLNLSPFEVVVAVAAVRPDSTYRAVIAFVDQLLGSGVMSGDSISRSVQWARATRPVILLAAHAVDALTAYALACSRTITMVGVEEGLSAWKAALEANRGWLAITVGASPFTRDLVSFVVSLSERSISQFNDDFRLWITAEDREIPSMLANTCVCVVIESPEGIKRNACGTLQSWSRDTSDASLSRLLARLALLHALIQERRNYIPLGWSRYYAWEWGDVNTCAAAVRWVGGGNASRELCGSLYAARVEAPADREVLRALLARCMLDPLPVFDGLSRTANMHDYITALESLPDIDPPQLLELPNNCRVAWEHNAAENIIHGLKELNTTVSIKKNDTTTPLKTLLSLWKKLMSGSPLIKPDYRIEKKLYGWWGAVCAAEVHDAATAARTLHVTLAALAHSRQAASVYKVPEEWQLLWSGPDTPEEYIEEFCMRARAAIERIKMFDFLEDYMPQEVDLRLFLRPQRILTAARVHAAGKRACDLRQMALTVKWNCSSDESEGIVVTGVNMNGAVWTGSALVAAQGGDPPHSPAPPLLFRYVPKDTDAGFESAFSIPLYASVTRETQLERVRAPLHSQYSSRTATLHAVALFVAPTHKPA